MTCEADYCAGSGNNALHYVVCADVRSSNWGRPSTRDLAGTAPQWLSLVSVVTDACCPRCDWYTPYRSCLLVTASSSSPPWWTTLCLVSAVPSRTVPHRTVTPSRTPSHCTAPRAAPSRTPSYRTAPRAAPNRTARLPEPRRPAPHRTTPRTVPHHTASHRPAPAPHRPARLPVPYRPPRLPVLLGSRRLLPPILMFVCAPRVQPDVQPGVLARARQALPHPADRAPVWAPSLHRYLRSPN
jgi:hypothetical protein